MHSFFRGNTCIATKVNFKFIVKNTEHIEKKSSICKTPVKKAIYNIKLCAVSITLIQEIRA